MNPIQQMIADGMLDAELYLRGQGVGRPQTIHEGDTFWDLENKNHLPHGSLQKWNPETNADNLQEGDIINITDPDQDLPMGTSGTLESPNRPAIGDGKTDGAKWGIGGLPETPVGKSMLRGLSAHPNEPGQATDAYFISGYLTTSKTATIFETAPDWVEAEQIIYNRFLSKHGGGYNYATAGIGRAMIGTDAYTTMMNKIGNIFRNGMKDNNGDYSKIKDDHLTVTPPNFSDASNGLHAMVGGTQRVDVWLRHIYMKGSFYTATLIVSIYDTYGVSEDDFTKYNYSGFRPDKILLNEIKQGSVQDFWVLQHNRGYQPFVNVFTFKHEISGDFNKNNPLF